MSYTVGILESGTFRLFLLPFFAPLLFGADAVTPGLVRGNLLAAEGTALSGTLSIRDEENHVTRCAYDSKTYIEIDNSLATASQLRVGDRLEVLTDRQPGSTACYIRSIHARISPDPETARRPPYRAGGQRRGPLPGDSAYFLDNIYPRGNLTFSGVVIRLNPERLVLHTRSADEIIFLRSDTRYLAAGIPVQAKELRVNRRVFVRAGRNLDNELEAFQVVWGEILQPK